jgi:hypothetical protein
MVIVMDSRDGGKDELLPHAQELSLETMWPGGFETDSEAC